MSDVKHEILIEPPWSKPSFYEDERLRSRVNEGSNPPIAIWLSPLQRREIRWGAAEARRKLEIPPVIVEEPELQGASQAHIREPEVTLNTPDAVRAYISRDPRIVEDLLRKETRAHAIWRISNKVCGTREHEKPNRNVYQFIGRRYPLRQTNKRPKTRRNHPLQ